MSLDDVQTSLIGVALKLNLSYMLIENKGCKRFAININTNEEDPECLINFMKEVENKGFRVTSVEMKEKNNHVIQVIKMY